MISQSTITYRTYLYTDPSKQAVRKIMTLTRQLEI